MRFRSLLSVPGNRPDMLAKATGYGADAVSPDLEDAVPPAEKEAARAVVAEHVPTLAAGGVEVVVRVNGPSSGLLADDLAAVLVPGLAGVQVPKVDSPADVRMVDEVLTRLERERGLPRDSVGVLVSMESARGVQRAYDVLAAAGRVASVMVAAAEDGDLHQEMGWVSTDTEEELSHVRAAVLLAARAARVPHPIDGVFARLGDTDALAASARRARQLGYQGKKVIHPAQVPVVNEIFSPTPQELDRYARIVEAMEVAAARGRGTAVVDGRMVDVAMAATARARLAVARRPPGR